MLMMFSMLVFNNKSTNDSERKELLKDLVLNGGFDQHKQCKESRAPAAMRRWTTRTQKIASLLIIIVFFSFLLSIFFLTSFTLNVV